MSANPTTIKCPYCEGRALRVTGEQLYPHRPDLFDLRFFRCEPCDAHVGCHGKSWRPKGSPADAELRRARIQAHGAFDLLWKSGRMSRNSAYSWLRKELGVGKKECHIAMFDVDTCWETTRVSERKSREAAR